jgi:hypothetical protein
MDPDVRFFLMTIVQSISMVMLWMLLNMTFGIYYGFAFFDDGATLGNYIYYPLMVISFVFLIRYLKNKWKGWKEPGE